MVYRRKLVNVFENVISLGECLFHVAFSIRVVVTGIRTGYLVDRGDVLEATRRAQVPMENGGVVRQSLVEGIGRRQLVELQADLLQRLLGSLGVGGHDDRDRLALEPNRVEGQDRLVLHHRSVVRIDVREVGAGHDGSHPWHLQSR